MDTNMSLKDKLLIGLGEDINNYIYYGGDFDSHLHYFRNNQILTNEKFPNKEMYCKCGHYIINNCYIKHKKNNMIKVIGSCCIKRFMKDRTRKCFNCKQSHKNTKNNFCNDCRNKCYNCNIYHEDNLICKFFTCEKCEKTFRKECNINKEYFKYCDYCKYIIEFGKYKNAHFDVLETDNDYLIWLYNNFRNDKIEKKYIRNNVKEILLYYNKKYGYEKYEFIY